MGWRVVCFVMSSDTDGHFTGSPAFDAGSQDEGFLPSVGHMADATLSDDTTGGATSDTDATEGPNIHP